MSFFKPYKPQCIMSVQYTGGCAVRRGMFSTLGDVQYTGGFTEYTGGCSVYWGISWVRRGCSVHWGISWVHQGVFSTLGFPHKFNRFPNDLPPHLSWYPRCTHDTPQCTEYPHCTHDIPRCTEQPRLYCTDTDDYAKNGVPRAVWTLCSFKHNSLRY